MNDMGYVNFIKNVLLESLEAIYIIDTIGDKVLRYKIVNDNFELIDENTFMEFYNQLETVIHPDDFGDYVQGLTGDNPNIIKQEYRKKNIKNEYDWYTSVIKQKVIAGKKIDIVLVENINNGVDIKNNKIDSEDLLNKHKLLVSNASDIIFKINQLVNANCDSNNLEVKAIVKYLENIIDDLVRNVPELYYNIRENMVGITNQNRINTILVVDDDEIICNLLIKTFGDIYNVDVAHNGEEAIEKLAINIDDINSNNRILGMFLDLNMPQVNGFGVLEYMTEKNLLTRIPVIIISGDYGENDKVKVYSYPIADVLEKPFNVQIVKHRVNNLVNLYKNNNYLNEVILTGRQQTKEILNMCVKSYLCDDDLEISKVTKYAELLIGELNREDNAYNINDAHLVKILDAIKYFDIGFAPLPRKIWNNKDNNEEEEKLIINHPLIGLNIFEAVLYRSTDSLFNHYARDIIRYHHEYYDGSGYPYGLKEDNIPIVSQIVNIIVDYVNLSKYVTEDEALNKIISNSGKKYNPVLVKTLEKISSDLKNI